jgi:hypothetical protein
MMKLSAAIRLLWSVLLAVSMAAGPVALAEVTAVYRITESPGSYLQMTLTHDIYRYSNSSQLRDLAVIDSQGNPLPFRIVEAAVAVSEPLQSQPGQIQPVRFFPVAQGSTPETWLQQGNTRIRIDDSATSISISQERSEDRDKPAMAPDFYLVDLGDVETPVSRLTLNWKTRAANQYLEVQVSGTQDLQNWTFLAQHSLADLQNDSQSLLRNEIPLTLNANKYAYLRVKFLRGGEGLQLTAIHALTSPHSLSSQPVRDVWQIEGTLAVAQHTVKRAATNVNAGHEGESRPVAAWEYYREDIMPVSTLRVALGATPYGDDIRLYSRGSPRQAWHEVHRGIWFNQQIGNAWQSSDPIRIEASSDRWWRLELNPGLRDKPSPSLVFEQPVQILQFIANQSAPYHVAIDTPASSRNPDAATQIFRQLVADNRPSWIPVESIKLNPAIITPVYMNDKSEWTVFIFWAALLIAVAVLVGFSVRLYRQMG